MDGKPMSWWSRAAGLIEGFTKKAADKVSQYFARHDSTSMQTHLLPASVQVGAPSVQAALTAGRQYGLGVYGVESLTGLSVDQDLLARYADYENMDDYPEIASALDIYADDATMPSLEAGGRSIWVTSPNNRVVKDLDHVLHDRVKIEDDIWGLARTLAKYGNAFGELLISDKGLVGINYLPPPTMRRVEDERTGRLLGFVQDFRGGVNISPEEFVRLLEDRRRIAAGLAGKGQQFVGGRAVASTVYSDVVVFEDWEVIHWRIMSKHMRSAYGFSIMEPARWIWKRLSLLEDAVLIYKLSRAPSRYAFYVDIGELDAARGLAYINQVKNQFIKRKFYNPATGQIDLRHNPLAMDEDFWIPVRNGKETTRIDVLQGPDYSEVDTLEYHRDKLVSALKVPKPYLGYGGEATRAALSSEDIRFARTVMRLQRELRNGFKRALRVHMIAVGVDPDKVKYEVAMTVPSSILELARMEAMSATSDVAQRMAELVSNKWILMKLFKFSEQEVEQIEKEREEEAIRRGELEAKVQQAQELGGEGEFGFDREFGGGEEEPGFGGEEEPEGGEEGVEGAEEARQPRPLLGSRDSANRPRHRRRVKLSQPQRQARAGLGEFRSAPGCRSNGQEAEAERRLEELLRTDRELAKRVRTIEGLLRDVRASTR